MRLRRRFVLLSVPAVVGGWALSHLGLYRNSDIEELLGLLREANGARTLGEACAKAIGETSARRIARILPTEARALRARIREDFAEGRTIIADGWVLSATEARLYALATLV